MQITLFFFIISIKIPFKFQLINVDKKNFNPVDYLILNISIHLNFILILSFLNINISQILICYFIFIILNFLFNIKNLKNYYKKIKNYFFSITIVFLTLFIISIDVSNLITLGWDAQKFWFYKAINFYDNGNLESLKYLMDMTIHFRKFIVVNFLEKALLMRNILEDCSMYFYILYH